MPQIHLDDQVFNTAQRRAADAGYSSVDEYVADVVTHDADVERSESFDHAFTRDRLAELERISAEIKAGGKTYSMAEVQEHLEQKRRAWLANQAT